MSWKFWKNLKKFKKIVKYPKRTKSSAEKQAESLRRRHQEALRPITLRQAPPTEVTWALQVIDSRLRTNALKRA